MANPGFRQLFEDRLAYAIEFRIDIPDGEDPARVRLAFDRSVQVLTLTPESARVLGTSLLAAADAASG